MPDDGWRKRWVLRLALGFLLYIPFAGGCILMEVHARQRFAVPSKVDVAALPRGPERVRLELARLRAMGERDAWPPYKYFMAAMNVVVAGAFIAGLGAFPYLWRQGIRNPKIFAVGFILLWLLPFAIVAAPALVAESHAEGLRSPPAVIQELLARTQTRPAGKGARAPAR
jgi:hypothetical protein